MRQLTETISVDDLLTFSKLPMRQLTIDAAFSRIDQGIGTDADFKVIRDFAEKVKSAMTTPTQNPLETAKTLPKASALNGGALTGAKLSEEEILKYVEEGRENELPTEIRKQIDDLCGD